jgi:hypothetical protein
LGVALSKALQAFWALAIAIPIGAATPATADDQTRKSSPESFIGLSRNERQATFLSVSAIVKTANGEIQSHVYQVMGDGMKLGDKTARYADFTMAYDCTAMTFHPVATDFLDDQFGSVATSKFPTNQKPIAAGPNNAWGFAYACNPSSAPDDRRFNSQDWHTKAVSLFAEMPKPKT